MGIQMGLNWPGRFLVQSPEQLRWGGEENVTGAMEQNKRCPERALSILRL